MSEIIQLPALDSGRPETGPMQFGDDWPGVFIRGDNALFDARAIDAAKIMNELVDKMMAEAIGFPPNPNRLTAIRYVGGRFEAVEIDDDGKIIEPPTPCCYGGALHAPNCKFWSVIT